MSNIHLILSSHHTLFFNPLSHQIHIRPTLNTFHSYICPPSLPPFQHHPSHTYPYLLLPSHHTSFTLLVHHILFCCQFNHTLLHPHSKNHSHPFIPFPLSSFFHPSKLTNHPLRFEHLCSIHLSLTSARPHPTNPLRRSFSPIR